VVRAGALDLSLTSTGMVAAPVRWGRDWSKVAVHKAGRGCKKDAPEHERIVRVLDIRNQVLRFVIEQEVTVVVIEQYAFTSDHGHAHALGELGGAVKIALLERGIDVQVTSPATARKCLGKQPRAQAKVWAHQKLYTLGAPHSWTGDQLDAFVMLNNWFAENEGDAFILPAVAA
jgi:Holliday junction resolvasome RuvABC endonuclease subunit